MIYFRCRTITGGIAKIFKGIANVIYKIFNFLNLQYTLFVVLIGAILWILGVFNKSPIVLSIFFIVFALSVFLGIVITVRKVLKLGNKNGKAEAEEKTVNEENLENLSDLKVEKTEEIKAEEVIENVAEETNKLKEEPKYYSVAQNKNYIMAEYSDRYELFLKTEKGLKRVRVDYKR